MCTHTHTHTYTHTYTHIHTHYMCFVNIIIPVSCSVLGAGMTHSKLLIEIPVTLKASRLENALLCELDAQDMGSEKMEFLGLSAT